MAHYGILYGCMLEIALAETINNGGQQVSLYKTKQPSSWFSGLFASNNNSHQKRSKLDTTLLTAYTAAKTFGNTEFLKKFERALAVYVTLQRAGLSDFNVVEKITMKADLMEKSA